MRLTLEIAPDLATTLRELACRDYRSVRLEAEFLLNAAIRQAGMDLDSVQALHAGEVSNAQH